MRYLSVCSGIEAATVAWHPLGWEAVAYAEVDAFPSAVLKHHYPTVPNYGDMTKFQEWPDADVDLLVGGTPCQSFSVAGLRKGLDDPRGSLMLVYLALARRYRPRWLVWENVPGVLSADDGRAFGSLLGGLAELGYGFAYRVLDAQYFGLAQRRQRVFVVGCLGDWRRAAAVLFERESLSGHPAPRREAGQVAAAVATCGFDVGGTLGPRVSRLTTDECADGAASVADIAPTLNAAFGKKLGLENQHIDGGAGLFIAHSLRADGFDASGDGTGRGTPLVPTIAPCLTGNYGKQPDSSDTSAGPMLIPVAHAFDARQSDVIQYGDYTGPLDTDGHTIAVAFLHANKGRPAGRQSKHTEMVTVETETIPTLTTDGHAQSAVAFSAKDYGSDAGDIAPTLRAGGHANSHANGGVMPAVALNLRGRDGGSQMEASDVASLRAASGGSSRSYIAHETLYNQGINHVSAPKTHAGSLLRALREEVGAEAFTQWGLGILDSLLPAEVLRSRLHGCGVRLAAFSRRWLVYHALSRPEAHSEGIVLAMREAEREGCASQGWRPPEQLARELGAYLSELSHPGAQASRFMLDLWQAGEGLGLLRQALSAVQEVGRPAHDQGEPAPSTFAVRRLTVEECEFLQGFPRGYTAIPYRGKLAADGPRYKALGNSMAVPCMRWIGERIQMVNDL